MKEINKKMKRVIIQYDDGTEEVLNEGLLFEVKKKEGYGKELKARTFNFGPDTMEQYLIGITHFIAETLEPEILDKLEAEADYLEEQQRNRKNKKTKGMN